MSRKNLFAFIILLLLLANPSPASGEPAKDRVEDRGDYVVVHLGRDFTMNLLHAGGLAPASSFQNAGEVVVNCQFFAPSSGCTLGRTRVGGRTIANDGRLNGRGLTWNNGSDWELVDTSLLGRAYNGFHAGPTLLSGGRVNVRSEAERVRPNVYGVARRVGLARLANGDTILVTTKAAYTLQEFAYLLQSEGGSEAVGLDGGGSTYLAVDGQTLIHPSRQLPSVLAFKFNSNRRLAAAPAPSSSPTQATRRPSVARPHPQTSVSLVSAPVLYPDTGRVEWLDPYQNPRPQIAALGDVLVVSPDFFNPGSAEPLGALRTQGRPVGTHIGPSVGFTWAISPGTFHLGPCRGVHLADGHLGGCGPLLLNSGQPYPLVGQGFSPNGGLFERARRMALCLDHRGQFQLIGSESPVSSEAFANSLKAHCNYAVGLSGGDQALLYSRGDWLIEPALGARIPYVFVFAAVSPNQLVAGDIELDRLIEQNLEVCMRVLDTVLSYLNNDVFRV